MPQAGLQHIAHAEPTQGLHHFLEMLDRRKWPALLTFVGAFTLIASVVTFLPDVYHSSATVLIERQQIPDDLVRSTVTSALEVRLQTITQEIMSRTRLEELIQRFDLYPQLKQKQSLEKVIEKMRSDVRVELKKGERDRDRDKATVAFSIGYAGGDPKTVALVANTLASFYIDENLKARERQASGTADFLRVQLDEANEKLGRLEKQVSAFKERHIGSLPQQMEANLATLEQLNTQLRLNGDRQAQNNLRRAPLEQQLQALEGSDSQPKTRSERLGVLRRSLTELRARYSDKYPDVIRLKAEIAALEAQIQEARARGEEEEVAPTSPQVAQLRRQLSDLDVEAGTLQREADSLRQSIGQYRQRVELTPRREQEFQALSREYETTQELYRSLMTRGREAALAESMEQRQKGEQFRILDPALPSLEPAAPQRVRLLIMGCLLALGLAAGVVFLKEMTDPSIHSRDELQALTSLRVLVSIPAIVTEQEALQRRQRFRIGAMSAAAGVLLLVAVSYFVARGNTELTALLLR